MNQDTTRTINEIKKVDYWVERNLANKEFTRNSDTYLALEGMWDMGLIMKTPIGYLIPYDNITKIPALESWKRRRAHFQNDLGKYPPTDERVKRQRKTREKVFKVVSKL